MLRTYTLLETNYFSKFNPSRSGMKYLFDMSAADGWKDAVIAGIIFTDGNIKYQWGLNTTATIAMIYVFTPGAGFKVFSFGVKLDPSNTLNFWMLEQMIGDMPEFQQNAGDLTLQSFISALQYNFEGKDYVLGTRDLYKIIETMGWQPEIKIVQNQRSKYGYQIIKPSNFLKYALIGCLVIGAIGFFGLKKKQKA